LWISDPIEGCDHEVARSDFEESSQWRSIGDLSRREILKMSALTGIASVVSHPGDTNPAPLDPNFEGSAILTAEYDGQYRFKTIKPAAYPVSPNMIRPAHIHFKISGQQDGLVTQMYFEGDPYNTTDRLLQAAGRTELLITKLLPPTAGMEPESKLVVFDIVLNVG
jgi:protocatechuate 3,4-dioxygenase beta subunit